MCIRDSFKKCLKDSAISSANTLFIIGTSTLFTYVMAMEGISRQFADVILGISSNPNVVLLVINVLLLVLGMVMEPGAILTLMLPVLLPIANGLGLDLVHFGVMVVLNLRTGSYTHLDVYKRQLVGSEGVLFHRLPHHLLKGQLAHKVLDIHMDVQLGSQGKAGGGVPACASQPAHTQDKFNGPGPMAVLRHPQQSAQDVYKRQMVKRLLWSGPDWPASRYSSVSCLFFCTSSCSMVL